MFGKKKENIQDIVTEILLGAKIPGLGKSAAAAGAVLEVSEETGIFTFLVKNLPSRKSQIELDAAARTRLSERGIDQSKIIIKFDAPPAPKVETTVITPSAPPSNTIPGVKRVFAVGSGKGGVGKSTVTVNLAASLVKAGYKVGILDADIYGPSIGKMMGLNGRQPVEVRGDRIIPLQNHGITVMSFAFLIEENAPVIWRASMLNKAMNQLLHDVEWGELDYMIIDLPPGTGDTQLNLSQMVKTDGAVVVTTPQNVALLDATRAVHMFEKVNIPVVGVIENMSEFICPHCGKPSHIFSHGGGETLAEASESALLGRVPLTMRLMESGEKGEPLVLSADTEDPQVAPVQSAYAHILQNFLSVIAHID